MPATALRCRNCETELGLEGIGACPRCLAPLEPVYDPEELARTATRERIAARSALALALRAAPARGAAGEAASRGLTPLVRAPRLAEAVGVRELWLKLDTANPTHSFKDRVVAVACAKAQELGLTTLACSSTGNLANAVAARAAAEGLEAASVLSRRPGAREARRHGRLRRDPLRRGRELRRLLPAHRRALVRAAFVGVRQRRPAHVLRRGLEDARVRDRRAARWRTPRRWSSRSPPARSSPGCAGSASSWTSASPRADARGSTGARRKGCSPVATAFAAEQRVVPVRPATGAHSLAIGSPADGDAAVASARKSHGAVYAVPEAEVGENMSSCWPSAPGSSARPRPASRSARWAGARASWAPTTRSCSSSPATGSRRPSPCQGGCSRSRSRRTRTLSSSGSARRPGRGLRRGRSGGTGSRMTRYVPFSRSASAHSGRAL